MNTFSSQLSSNIRVQQGFWTDIESVWPIGLSKLLNNLTILEPADDENLNKKIQRLVEAASIFSLSDYEKDKLLSQYISLFSALASESDLTKQIALDLFSDLGNHPTLDKLYQLLEIKSESFTSKIKNLLLRNANSVLIDDKSIALTDFQLNLWNQLSSDRVNAISAPTSAGKSFIIMEHIYKKALNKNDFKCVYIAPTRALLSEISHKIKLRTDKNQLNFHISTIPKINDSIDKIRTIYVLTQERLEVLLNIWEGSFDLVIVDKAQAISDGSRGMILQDTLERLNYRNQNSEFIFITPGATGFDELSESLGLPNPAIKETQLSPVIQNKFVLSVDKYNQKQLNLSILLEERSIKIGKIDCQRGLQNKKTRLASIVLELGNSGSSLVYATGPADAETTAKSISSALGDQKNEKLFELADFIKKHVYKDYSLANCVLKGVAFHYGNMPAILREAIEESFKKGHLKYLVCTTTLFQGVNLPARNVFIHTPQRGNRKDQLNSASLWNFAGRAGRLGSDVVGNVFLIDYNEWGISPFSEKARYLIQPSFKSSIINDYEEIIDKLNTPVTKSEFTSADSAIGLLLSKSTKNELESYINRTVSTQLSFQQINTLYTSIHGAIDRLSIPAELIQLNWTVSSNGQSELYDRISELVKAGEYTVLIPIHPSENNSLEIYLSLFGRINKYLLGQEIHPSFTYKLARSSIDWMQGRPISRLISDEVKRRLKKSTTKKIKIDTAVRSIFEFVDKNLRFKYVQLGKAYIDILSYVLRENGLENECKAIFDFPLALELGVSTKAGQAFIELGLSRITASTLENLIPDSSPSLEQAIIWLRQFNPKDFDLSPVIIDELERKELLQPSK